MLRLIRQEHESPRGALTLVSREWAAVVGGSRFGVGISYVRPSGVAVGDASPVRIVDHLMVVRAALLMASLLAAMLRSVRRD